MSTIRTQLETTESQAAPARVAVIAPGRSLRHQRPRGAAPMGDRMLLRGTQLGHRPAVAEIVGDERRVVAEAAVPARALGQPPLAARLTKRLGAVLVDVGDRADVGDGAVVGPADLGEEQVEVLVVGRIVTGVTGRADAGAAAERGGGDPGVVGDRRAAGLLTGGAGLAERVRRRTSRRPRAAARLESGSGSSSKPARISPSSSSLCGLRVATTIDRPGGRPLTPPVACSWTPRSSAIPPSARARSSSSEARESGVRSAVAWTSTSPPSPVMTTLASTSARRVLGVVEVAERTRRRRRRR